MEHLAANERSIPWLQVFNNSKVNGAPYGGDYLPAHSWEWPTDTYLQRRLLILRGHSTGEAKTGMPAGTERRSNDIFCPAGVLEMGESLASYPKKSRKRRRISRPVGALKQRRQSS